MHQRPIAVLCVTGVMALAACGQAAAPTRQPTSATFTPAPTPTPTPDVAASGNRPGDQQVQLSAVLYPPGSPCAGVTTTSQMTQVSSACQLSWAQTSLSEVPGGDLLTNAPLPHAATVTQGVTVATGTADANAYFKWQALQYWALNLNQPSLLALVDGPFATVDPFLKAENEGGTVQPVPACFYPNAIRVINVDPTVDAYIATQGLSSRPSSVAILATFPACSGVSIFFTGGNGHSATIAAATHTFSQVYTGTIQSDAAFGDIWVLDGFADCGAAALQSVCN